MDDTKQVVNTEVKETPAVEPTPQQTTENPTTESGTVDKQTQTEDSDGKIPYSRFKEVNEKMKAYEAELQKVRLAEAEKKFPTTQEPVKTEDPYANMTPEEVQQTKAFVNKFVMPEVQPWIQEMQRDKLNKQIVEAKDFSKNYGIDFDQKLPEIVDFLSRPENKGRLTATEAVRNLYFDQITGSVKTKTAEELQNQKNELMEKKKQANMQGSTVSPNTVIATDQMARQNMTREERMQADIRDSIAAAKRGEKSPKVRSESGSGLYNY
jgi:hypothetical protein